MATENPAGNVPSTARAMVRQAAALRISDLGAHALDKLKVCLLDFLSCAFEARDLPWSEHAIAIAPRMEGGATVIATHISAPAGDAAFANATMGHGLVREDMHAASISHHGVVIWPVLLALAERGEVSGARMLTAAAIGYEVGGRLGRALFNSDLARLYRPTGVLGPMAGAVAGSLLLGLGEDASVSALALGANAAGGLNQWPHEGSSDMYFHPGFAARGAVAAVDLAKVGAYGSEKILEGEAGLFAAFRRAPCPAAITLFPNGEAEILAVYNKPAPACNFAQTACQAALRVAHEIESVEAISSICVHLPEAAIRYPGCDFAGPFERALQAKMSIQFGVAATLVRKALEEQNYRRLDDFEVLRLATLTKLKTDRAFTAAFPRAQGAEVVVTLKGGATISRRIPDVIAATENEIRQRFRAAAGAVLGAGQADAIEEMVDRLETAADAGRVAALCAPAPSRTERRPAQQKRRVSRV